MNEYRNPIYTEWKTLKNIKSKTLKPGCRLVSIFWTIDHFSDTRAVFTPTLDSPVMHCTLPCTVPVHYGREGDIQLYCTYGLSGDRTLHYGNACDEMLFESFSHYNALWASRQYFAI